MRSGSGTSSSGGNATVEIFCLKSPRTFECSHTVIQIDMNNNQQKSVVDDCPDCPTSVDGGVGVNTVEGDIKITNNLIGKELCLHNLLSENGNTFIKGLLENFKGDSEFDIKIESKDTVISKGVEVNATTRSPIKGVIRIQISTSKAINRPALAVARTILHEYIHADMFRKLNTKYPLTSEELNFKKTYEYFKNGNFNPDNTQHETMASLYIGEMTKTLKGFHKTALAADYNYLTNNGINPIPDAFYEALAWQGLKENDVQAYIDLSDDKKAQLQNSINDYYHSTTKNCPNSN